MTWVMPVASTPVPSWPMGVCSGVAAWMLQLLPRVGGIIDIGQILARDAPLPSVCTASEPAPMSNDAKKSEHK